MLTKENQRPEEGPHFSHQFLQHLILAQCPNHPFDDIRGTQRDVRPLLAEYLAMSMAFPYLQAGACGPLVLNSIQSNQPVANEVALTSVVGSFLVWDEMGGWFNTSQRGARGLTKILDTRMFHANILRDDLNRLYGEEVKPNFGPSTQQYLLSLYEGLAHSDNLVRCATMVSFELHAERMITALWGSVHRIFGTEKNKLRYFASHVGGDDPAEAYHVQMTENLTDMIARDAQMEFEKTFLASYQIHTDWCGSLVDTALVA